MGGLTYLKQVLENPHATDSGQAWEQSLPPGGKRRLLFIQRIDIRLAHQLPGKPAAEARPSLPLGLMTITRVDIAL